MILENINNVVVGVDQRELIPHPAAVVSGTKIEYILIVALGVLSAFPVASTSLHDWCFEAGFFYLRCMPLS